MMIVLNQIKWLNGKTFNGLLQLKDLNLSFNQIELIDDYNTFSSVSNLNKLDLSNNLIEIVHRDAFNRLPFLIDLNLERNNLDDE